MFLRSSWHVNKKHFIKSWVTLQAGLWFCRLITWTKPTCWATASPSSPKDSCTVADPPSSSRTALESVSTWHSYGGWRISKERRWSLPQSLLIMCVSSAVCLFLSSLFFAQKRTHTFPPAKASVFFGRSCLNFLNVSLLFPSEWLWLCLRLLLFLLHLYQIQRTVSERAAASRQSHGWYVFPFLLHTSPVLLSCLGKTLDPVSEGMFVKWGQFGWSSLLQRAVWGLTTFSGCG